jgi:hypothetical protein
MTPRRKNYSQGEELLPGRHRATTPRKLERGSIVIASRFRKQNRSEVQGSSVCPQKPSKRGAAAPASMGYVGPHPERTLQPKLGHFLSRIAGMQCDSPIRTRTQAATCSFSMSPDLARVQQALVHILHDCWAENFANFRLLPVFTLFSRALAL